MNGPALFDQLPNLTLREKIAQLIFVRIGSNLPPVRIVEDDEQRIAKLLETCPVGGLLMFNGGLDAPAALARLQVKSAVPLLVGADIERGVGQQAKGYTLFPHAMAFGRLRSDAPAAVTEYCEILAREAREVGIHITFGPVADVNTNPRNPIIATRAFSDNTSRAVELTRAYVRSAEATGLGTTAKHFPGHGSTFQDSHDSLPTVERSIEELRACELPPFQAAIDAGCSLVMTAHVAYPAIDPSGMPATLSKSIMTTLLREQMGFRGVVCSDSLLMAGVRGRFATEEEMAVGVLAAGVDVLVDFAEPERVVDHLCQCVENGTLDKRRIDEALARVWTLKRRVFAKTASEAQTGGRRSNANALAERVAREAIEIMGVRSSVLPFDPKKPLVAILMKPFETHLDPPEQPLAAALRERLAKVHYVQLGPRSDAAAFENARRLAAQAEQLLLAVIVRPAAWHAFDLRPPQRELAVELTRKPGTVLASLGVPYVLQDYPDAAVRISSYSDVPVSQHALAEYLCN